MQQPPPDPNRSSSPDPSKGQSGRRTSATLDNIQINISRKTLKTAGLMAAMLAIGVGIGFGVSNLKPSTPAVNTNSNTTATTTGSSQTTPTTTSTTTPTKVDDSGKPLQITDAVEKPQKQLSFKELLDSGTSQLAHGAYDQAVFSLDQALSLDSKSVDAYHLRGLAELQLQQNQDALRDFDNAVSLEKNHRDSLLDRAFLYFKSGDAQRALSDYQQILGNSPTDADAIYGAALCRRKLGETSEAMRALQGLASSNPTYSKAYLAIGRLHMEHRNYPQALNSFSAGLQQDPKSDELYAIRGRTYVQLRDYKRALADYNKATQINGSKFEYLNDRGYTKILAGDYYSALEDFKIVKDRKPDSTVLAANLRTACEKLIQQYQNILRTKGGSAKIYSYLANGYLYLPDLSSAMKYATEALRLNPNEPLGHHILGLYWFEKKDYKKARECFTSAISVDPQYWDSYFERARAGYRSGDNQIMIDDNTKYLQKYPDSQAAFNNRSLGYTNLKQYDKAEDDLTKALALDPSDPHALDNMGRTLRLMTRYEESVRFHSRCIELNKESIRYSNRGYAYQDWEKYDLALKDFERALAIDKASSTATKERLADDYYDIAIAYDYMKKYSQAQQFIEEALKLAPKTSYVVYQAGRIAENAKDLEKALACYTEYCKLNPKNPSGLQQKADVLSTLKRFDEALAAADELIKVAPTNSYSYHRKACVYYEAGRNDESVRQIDDGLKLDKKNSSLYLVGAYAAAGMKDWKKCLEYSQGYEEALQEKSPSSLLTTVLMRWLSYKQLGDSKKAEDTLIKGASVYTSPEWPRPILDYIAKGHPPETLLASAPDQDKETEARTWIGISQLLKGEKDKAKENFQWVVSKGTQTYLEVPQSNSFLKDL